MIAGNPNPLREIDDQTLGFRQLTKLNGPPGLPKVGRSRDTQASVHGAATEADEADEYGMEGGELKI